MKKIIKAFTLIELIVVISIITTLSASGVFYFLDFVKNQEINQKIELIKNDLEHLDKEIKNYDIFDYEIYLNTDKLALRYITYKNIFDLVNKNTIAFNTNSYTGNIITSGNNTLTGTIKLYKENKLLVSNTNTGGTTLEFNFNEKKDYKIYGTLSGEILNEININYFSEKNIFPEKNDLLSLIKISTGTTSINNLENIKIQNIGGKKKFYKNGNEIVSDKIYLYFENNGKEKFIKITK